MATSPSTFETEARPSPGDGGSGCPWLVDEPAVPSALSSADRASPPVEDVASVPSAIVEKRTVKKESSPEQLEGDSTTQIVPD